MHPELPHTLTIFNQLFRLAETHVEKEPDVLCWACLAAGALSECEHEESQDAFHEKRPFSAGVCLVSSGLQLSAGSSSLVSGIGIPVEQAPSGGSQTEAFNIPFNPIQSL